MEKIDITQFQDNAEKGDNLDKFYVQPYDLENCFPSSFGNIPEFDKTETYNMETQNTTMNYNVRVTHNEENASQSGYSIFRYQKEDTIFFLYDNAISDFKTERMKSETVLDNDKIDIFLANNER